MFQRWLHPLVRRLAVGVVPLLLAAAPASALASSPPPGPPAAATAFATATIGAAGGNVSGFGITASFAPGALDGTYLIVLGNWPNGLDVPPPNGEVAVKTFGLQRCAPDGTQCTSVFGDFPNSPAGTERVRGETLAYTGYQGVTFGSAKNKLVTISIATGGNHVYIYNANFNNTTHAYPALLPSTSGGGTLTFKTFRPIVWVVTTPASGT